MKEFLLSGIGKLSIYLLFINLLAFLNFGVDKQKAKKDRWRIPEKRLFALAILGGSIGALAGMHVFHHKTRHWYFRFGIPAILVLQLAIPLVIALLRRSA